MSSITVNRRVLQKLIPIAIGYLALGIACGILAQQAGLTPLEALGMSVLVFAGSGQVHRHRHDGPGCGPRFYRTHYFYRQPASSFIQLHADEFF